MEKLIINNDNLHDNDITEIVKRVKVLLVNSKNEILIAYSNNEYQFPGGHVEDNEELFQTINREIKEETGIELNIKDVIPFACTIGYYKDWPNPGNNRKTEIYYYEIKIDEKPNLNNTKYTENELNNNFELRYISLDKFEEELLNNVKLYGDKHGIANEMLEIFKKYMSNN